MTNELVATVTFDEEDEAKEEAKDNGDEDGVEGELVNTTDDESTDLSSKEIKQKVSEFIRKAEKEMLQRGRCGTSYQTRVFGKMLRKIWPLLQDNKYKTNRELYYEVRSILRSEMSCFYYLGKLAKEIGVCSTQLNIICDPKRGGIVASPGFKISIDGSAPQSFTRNVNICHLLPNFQLQAYGLPQDSAEEVDPDPEAEAPPSTIVVVGNWKPKFIVTFEKGAWPQELAMQGILEEEDLIFVDTQGYPSRNVLAFVRFLHDQWPDVPIVHGGDVGPIAVDIMLRFHSMKSTGDRFRVPIKWGFLLPSDVIGNADAEHAMDGSRGMFGVKDRQADARVRNHEEFVNSAERLTQLNLMRGDGGDHGTKYDMNGYGLAISPTTLKAFVLGRLRNREWI